MKKTNKKYFWYGLIAVCLGSLNPPVIKHASQTVDPITINFIRFAIPSLATLPFFLSSLPKLTRKNVYFSLLSGITLSLATVGFVKGVGGSTSSYAALLLLLSPVTLVFFSLKLTKDKVDTKRMAGFILSAVGALLIIGGPLFYMAKPLLSSTQQQRFIC